MAGRSGAGKLFETQPSDPLVLVSAPGLIVASTALATWIPARSAAKCDPCVLLGASRKNQNPP